MRRRSCAPSAPPPDDTGQLDSTWIIYIGKHGDMLSKYGMLMSLLFYDQSTKVPLIVRYLQKGIRVKNWSLLGQVCGKPGMPFSAFPCFEEKASVQ